MAKQGWISLHRSIQDNWIWKDEPFDKRSAWIDILLMANFKENKFLLGNELVLVEAGSFITSEKKLMEKWKWSNTKVRNFLSVLEKDGMIIKKTDSKKSTLTVVNYKCYQDLEKCKRSAQEVDEKCAESAKEVREHTNNKENNENHVNNANNENKKQTVISSESQEIIEYLNQTLGTNYKSTTKATQDVIKARLKEKYTVDDFKQVIDIKYAEWSGDPKTSVWLRPSTLFGNKFESYLNQKPPDKYSSLPKNLQNALSMLHDEEVKVKEQGGSIFD
ncbi:hypothetical protein GH810_02905 [Acetobacterium paludosum]|uniref:Phage conserved hypothetical protein C-terminal domain-containing protein n=1 Tax=Acetobacterium paludosum TaxID=52693 RepID=A0A923HRA8_9FIRM|nr:conserved phage C-terminal domain-containing protein [Acetobacterium paludosum]MBC3887258.1 hypothetical protein [Acetobacterium paludosum]